MLIAGDEDGGVSVQRVPDVSKGGGGRPNAQQPRTFGVLEYTILVSTREAAVFFPLVVIPFIVFAVILSLPPSY